jgi:hypothetical protein
VVPDESVEAPLRPKLIRYLVKLLPTSLNLPVAVPLQFFDVPVENEPETLAEVVVTKNGQDHLRVVQEVVISAAVSEMEIAEDHVAVLVRKLSNSGLTIQCGQIVKAELVFVHGA